MGAVMCNTSYEYAVREGRTFYIRNTPCKRCGGELFYTSAHRCVACLRKGKKVLRDYYSDAFIPVTQDLLLYIINNPDVREYETIARIMGTSKASVKKAMNKLNIPQRANRVRALRREGYRG